MVYVNTIVYGGMSMVFPVTYILHFLKHLILLLKCNLLGFHFYTLAQTLWGHAAQIFFKVETLLNNSFNASCRKLISPTDWNLSIMNLYYMEIIWNKFVNAHFNIHRKWEERISNHHSATFCISLLNSQYQISLFEEKQIKAPTSWYPSEHRLKLLL